MTAAYPLKAIYTGPNPTGIGEFIAGDFVDIVAGGTGKTTIAANKFWYASATDTLSEADITAAARTFLSQTTVALMRSNLGLVIGTASGQVITASADGVLPALDGRNLKNTVYPGMIGFWKGSISSIPANLILCDGTNGTVDLRDKFIVGAGTSYVPGATGGALTHTHVVTVQNTTLTINTSASHAHSLGDNPAGVLGVSSVSDPFPYGGGTRNFQQFNQTGSQGGDQPHSHGTTVATASNLPPYYALAYVMAVLI